jgi:hypothetical protein
MTPSLPPTPDDERNERDDRSGLVTPAAALLWAYVWVLVVVIAVVELTTR